MKKLFGILLSATMCLSSIFAAGCGLVEKDPTENEVRDEIYQMIEGLDLNAGSDFKGELKILYQNIPSEVTIIDSILSEFQKEYPNIEIKRQPTVETNFLSLVPANHATAYKTKNFSSMPDVLWTTNEILAGWVEKDILMPVNYFDDKDGKFSAEDTFVATMLQDSMLGSNLYMFPRDYDQIVMYYNRSLLRKAGVDESRIPSDRALTQSEFDALLSDIRNAFKDMDETNPLNNRKYSEVRSLDALFAWGSLCWPTLKGFGGSVMTEDGSVKFDTEENIAAATYIRELIENEYIFNGTTKHAQFVNQLTALCFETRATLTDLIDRTQDGVPGIEPEDLGVAPMPNLGREDIYAIGAGCSGYAMYRYAENPTAAWLFLKFMASEKGQNAFCATGNGVPSNKNMLFQDNAVWRNLTDEKFAGLTNFNHDAFVYMWDSAACTLQDFKLRIDVVSAREAVSKRMTNVMESCLKTKSATYKEDIKTYFKRGEANIYSTIEGYRNGV